MCRTGLRHCKPTEAQKRAAAERRKKNRHAHKSTVEELRNQGKGDIADIVSAMSPTKAKEYLLNENIQGISFINDLPDNAHTTTKLSDAVSMHPSEPIAYQYGQYGISDDHTLTEEELLTEKQRIKEGIISDLNELVKNSDNILDPSHNHVTDHIFSQSKWVLSEDNDDNLKSWRNAVEQAYVASGYYDINEVKRLVLDKFNDTSLLRHTYISDYKSTEEDSTFSQEEISQAMEFAGINVYKYNQPYYSSYFTPIGDRTYHFIFKDEDDEVMDAVAYRLNNGDLAFANMGYDDADDHCTSYVYGMLEIGSHDNQMKYIMPQLTPADFTLHDPDEAERALDIVSGSRDNTHVIMADEIVASGHYYSRNKKLDAFSRYRPDSMHPHDFRLFSGGIQVDDDNLKEINQEHIEGKFKGYEEEINDREESEQFISGIHPDIVETINDYTGSQYTYFIDVSKNIYYKPVQNPEYTSHNIPEAIKSIKEFEKGRDKPRYLRRTMMAPYGFNNETFSEALPVGSRLHTTRLTSTTADYNGFFKGNREDDVYFYYHTTKGAAVTTIGLPEEREVLIAPDTDFIVVKKHVDDDGALHVYLMDDEILEKEKSDS